MPPKARITKEMIVQAAFEIARAEGTENVNARAIAKKLRCSTQPVMYYFSRVEDIRIAAHKLSAEYHIRYLMSLNGNYETPMLEIGMRYICFAIEEKHLFRYLFQSDYYGNISLSHYLAEENLGPVFAVLREQENIDAKQAETVFSTIFLVVHGMASLLANNSMVYDEAYCIKTLSDAYFGAMRLIKGKERS